MIKATCVVISGEPLGRQERAEVKYSEVLIIIKMIMMIMLIMTMMIIIIMMKMIIIMNMIMMKMIMMIIVMVTMMMKTTCRKGGWHVWYSMLRASTSLLRQCETLIIIVMDDDYDIT